MRTTCKPPHLKNSRLAFAVLLMVFSTPATLTAAEQDALKRGVVHYEDFGAKGDGKTDDQAAIALAHQFANERGLPVKANDGATYYIGGGDTVAFIRTDTDFGKAKFIIDDTKVVDRTKHVFEVSSALEPIQMKNVASLKQNQKKIDIKLPHPCLVMVLNNNEKEFVRTGVNKHGGVAQRDLFLIDADGNIDPNTPIAEDFAAITEFTAFPIDKTPLKITGGHFTTIANKAKPEYKYYGRGIAIRRSNMVIDGLEHYVTGEGSQGAPYSAFFNIAHCANVTIRNAVLTAHKTYRTKIANTKKKMGTYDLAMNQALNVTLINCKQSNEINDEECWGIMATNGSKNLVFDGCTLNRVDSHQGVVNITVRNSTIGYGGIEVIGEGMLLLENTTVRKGGLVHLRPDYGSSWRGELIIRNCVIQPSDGKGAGAILGGTNNGQKDHGHTCHMPERITIEKLRIEDTNPPEGYEGPVVLGNFNPGYKDTSFVEKFPYIKTREVIVKDVTTASGKPLRLSDNPVMFRDVVAKGLGEK
jgi:hypothetical protein